MLDTVDPILKDTEHGSDLAAVTKAVQLALLCTKKQPSGRPSMNDVVRVLVSLYPLALVPSAAAKPHSGTPLGLDLAFHYPRYLDEYGNSKSRDDLTGGGGGAGGEGGSGSGSGSGSGNSSSTSAGHLFMKFEEVISESTV